MRDITAYLVFQTSTLTVPELLNIKKLLIECQIMNFMKSWISSLTSLDSADKRMSAKLRGSDPYITSADPPNVSYSQITIELIYSYVPE